MGKDVGGTAKLWATVLFGVFVLATIAIAFLPLVTTQFADNGAFENATCTNSNTTKPGFPSDNTSAFYCINNSYSTFYGAVPTILIIVFVISLIVAVLALLKMGKHR